MSDQPAAAVARPLLDGELVSINRAILVAAVVRGTVHSVNNILQTIGGLAEMVAQKPEAPDEVRRRAERVSFQTGRAAGYMRELSAFGRDLPSAPDRVNLRACVDRVHALREYDLQRAHVVFEADLGEGPLPAARIDLPALSMILLNLVLNAEQALAAAPDGRLQVTASAGGGRVLIRVADNGPGVPPDRRDRVFDAFYTTGVAGATLGLGLYVSRLLAVQHGGSLSLAETAAGARFDLELPALES